MQAIAVRDRDTGAPGLSLTDLPYPRAGRDRTPSVPGHELSGVVVELGYGTTGPSVGQRVFGLADCTRIGSLARYTVGAARNLAPLPADIDHTVAAAVQLAREVGACVIGTDRSSARDQVLALGVDISSTFRPRSGRMQAGSTSCAT